VSFGGTALFSKTRLAELAQPEGVAGAKEIIFSRLIAEAG
jgi:hypothetical protein